MRLVLPLIFLAGCSASELASNIKTADAIGRGVAHVIGWAEQNGATPADVVAAVTKAKEGDYAEALRLAALMVAEAKRQGHEPPDETATMLALAQELQAARAVEQGMRALGGRNPDGSAKP